MNDRYRRRAVEVEALHIVERETSKADILAFCPEANIGTPYGDDYDLRWIVVPTGENSSAHLAYGDVIVRYPDGHYRDYTLEEFERNYDKVFHPCQYVVRYATPESPSEFCEREALPGRDLCGMHAVLR